MKRALFAAAATLMLIAPIAAPAFAAPPQHADHRNDDRRDDNHRDSKSSSHSYRSDWRDDRRDARWDEHVHNGYYVKQVWHAGPPPASAYKKAGFQLGYKPWHKGDRLGDFNKRYVEVDYRDRHLPPPGRGQHYVRDDNTGDIILAAIATGLIVSIIASN